MWRLLSGWKGRASRHPDRKGNSDQVCQHFIPPVQGNSPLKWAVGIQHGFLVTTSSDRCCHTTAAVKNLEFFFFLSNPTITTMIMKNKISLFPYLAFFLPVNVFRLIFRLVSLKEQQVR